MNLNKDIKDLKKEHLKLKAGYIKEWNRLNEALKKQQDEFLKLIDEYKNPYPKDVFLWSNKEKVKVNQGRFNEHCFRIVENIKEDLKQKVKEMKNVK